MGPTHVHGFVRPSVSPSRKLVRFTSNKTKMLHDDSSIARYILTLKVKDRGQGEGRENTEIVFGRNSAA